ncbi:MAG TPA: hypothetical protein VFC72_05230 [Corynebacterium sp.]|nr:hypothetical protein [Corynebacterium sp.]
MFIFDLLANLNDIFGLVTSPDDTLTQLRPGGEGSISINSSHSS